LDGYEGSIARQGISPGLKIVGRWIHPVRDGPGFIVVIAKSNHRPGFALRRRPIQISGCIVPRITAQNHQGLDFARVQFVGEVNDARTALVNSGVQGYRVAMGAEHGIKRVRQQVNFHRLTLTGDHQSVFPRRRQIFRTLGNPRLEGRRTAFDLRPDGGRHMDHV